MGNSYQDLRYAFRILRRNPGFAGIAVLTLGLGIGATTAIFSVVNAVLIRPLPYEEPDRLALIWTSFGEDMPQNWVSGPEFVEMQEFTALFEDISVVVPTTVALTGSGEPEQIRAGAASGNFFQTMKVDAANGRLFTREDDIPGTSPVAVISDGFWKRRFGGDSAVLGRTIYTDGLPLTVIGILPPEFAIHHPDADFPSSIDVWIPMTSILTPVFGTAEYSRIPRGTHFMRAFGRMKPNVTLAQARADMDAVAREMLEKTPDFYGFEGWGITVLSLHADLVEDVRPALTVLLVAVAFVLLIAGVNVANLLLARAASREREVAIRAALGARRLGVVRQLVTESMTLSAIGGLAGLLLALVLVQVTAALASDMLPRGEEIGIDGSVLVFTLSVSVFTGVLFGLAPALQITRTNLVRALNEGGRGATGGRGRRAHSALVVAEVMLAIVLLVGAGLMIRSLTKMSSSNPGYDPDNVLTMRISLPSAGYDPPAQSAFYDRLLEEMGSLPGVVSAGTISQLPLSGIPSSGTTLVDRTELFRPDEAFIEADRRLVSPDYFSTMGIPIVQGRSFEPSDTADSLPVAIVDEEFVRRFWPNEDPVGRQISIDWSDGKRVWREVVGVVVHSKHNNLRSVGREQAYFPYRQVPTGSMYLVLRTRSEPSALVAAVRSAVWSIDGDQPVHDIATMEARVDSALGPTRFNSMLLSAFALLALMLAAVGVYGVVSYSVTQRNHEIGIRMAMGADGADVLAMILRQNLVTVGAGLILGFVAAGALTRLIAGLLYDVSTYDPATYISVAVVLLSAAVVACYVPALRATRVDPVAVLHQE